MTLLRDMMWKNKKQIGQANPGGNTPGLIRMVRKPSGKGIPTHIRLSNAKLIEHRIGVEIRSPLDEREKDMEVNGLGIH